MPAAEDHLLARDLAQEAGRRLIALRKQIKLDDLGKAGDRASHEFLMSALATARPGDAILSEEGRDNPLRLTADRVWIIDPLDGTREYAEAGRTDWAVHVALWARETADPAGLTSASPPGRLVAGAVALPAQGIVFSTADPRVVPARVAGSRPRMVVSRTRPPEFTTALAVQLDVEVVAMGSAGAKVAAVLAGDADMYVHAGGQYEWDSAAPVAVAVAAGLHASRLDGSPLCYNRPDPKLPDLLVCRMEIAGEVITRAKSWMS